MDSLSVVRRIKCLTIVDGSTRKCLNLPVAHGISDDQVVRTLDSISAFRIYPKVVRTDQEPEFTEKTLDQ
ncbi:integrase catalytic domain-containing protein [Gynuella sp.]|uniref:integrase catalytic domain-containing protein n=1 Tax=Gynuella sp. TaxID=2969146 RepID=UPI003D09B325